MEPESNNTWCEFNHLKERFTARPLRNNEDWLRVRQLLIESYPTTPVDFNWDIRRWDGWRFHRDRADWDACWANLVHVWETEGGRIIAAVHPENGGDACLQVNPDYRYLENEMLAWAEENLAIPASNQYRQLRVFAFEYDALRQRLLEQRAYEKMPWSGVTRRLRLDKQPLSPRPIAEGYTLRTTRPDLADYQRVADVLNASFGRDFHTARELYSFMTLSPSFRHELDFVAETADGSFAAYVGLTFDEANRRGIFEPVCTHPAHRRRGLAQTLMFEGLRRLKTLGAQYAYVSTGDSVPANQLYESVGFAEVYTGYIWRKQLLLEP